MSDRFNEYETSEHDGKPVSLYEFILPPATRYLYCSGALPVTIGSDTYQPLAIKHQGIVQSGEAAQDNFTISLPDTIPLVQAFRGRPPTGAVRVILREVHFPDDVAVVQWTGSVYEVSRPELGRADVTCAPLTNTLRRDALRLSWSRRCPHMVYDSECRANPNNFADSIRILAVNGFTLTYERVSGGPVPTDQSYRNGFIQFTVSGEPIMTAIDFHDGNRIDVLSNRGITPGLVVLAYKGCANTAEWCERVFNNLANFGGHEKIPGKSPFTTQPSF